MPKRWYEHKDIIFFITSVYTLTLLFDFSGISLLMALGQVTPMMGVILLLIFFPNRKRNLRRIGIHRLGNWRWYGIAILVVIPIILSFQAAWIVDIVHLPDPEKFPSELIGNWDRFKRMTQTWFSPFYFLMPFLWAMGEEMGWRGYLQPRLMETTSHQQAILYTAFVWSVYHYPALMVGYNDDGNMLISIILFTLAVIPLSIIMGWIRIRSFSIWPVIVLHTLVNQQRNFWEMVFYPKEDGWSYFAGENGMITILLWLIVAIIIWRKLIAKKRTEKTDVEKGCDD